MSGCLDDCTCRALCCCSCCCEALCDQLAEIDWSTKRNFFASVIAGILFFSGWWIMIDMAATSTTNNAYFAVGVGSTIAFFMVNAISASQLDNDLYQEGCLAGKCARMWLFLGFLITFASVVGSGAIFIVEMDNVSSHSISPTMMSTNMTNTTMAPINTLHNTVQLSTASVSTITAFTGTTAPPTTAAPLTQFQKVWPGTSILLQNVLIFFASMVFKFGRSEEFY